MDIKFDNEIALQLLFSFIIGSVIGAEREYKSKAAGLRTMIMICLGSTIFTELSLAIGGPSQDRIASNIITGIGFLGAGVIFKDGLTISGITTATTIWITAALGMAVGSGEYFIAIVGCAAQLIVLLFFEKIQMFIERIHQERTYKITTGDSSFLGDLEKAMETLQLKFHLERESRNKDNFILFYQVFGSEKKLGAFNSFLKAAKQVAAYEY
jgi:putative Mg2+ transporter-C (MgtC) family protein